MSDTLSLQTANSLLKIKSVLLNTEEPFTLTSGRQSPVYIDGRRLISFPKERQEIMDGAVVRLQKSGALDGVEFIAGGETAGIPYAAWIAERLDLPMLYVRKSPKKFGRMAQIEGCFDQGQKVLLVEDLTTDGGSKIVFCDVLRKAGAEVTDVFSIFYYDIFEKSASLFDNAGLKLHYLTTWWDVLAEARKENLLDAKALDEVERFLKNPETWAPSGQEKEIGS